MNEVLKQYLNDLIHPSPCQPIRKPMSIGRNDPCPCGSNKKFKKCCLIQQEQKEADARQALKESFDEWFKKDEDLGKQRIVEATANPSSHSDLSMGIPEGSPMGIFEGMYD
jgi:hypothetical protein